MHCPRTHAPSILTPIHLRQKDPGPLVRSVCSLQWRLAEDIHQFRNSHANRKFHESRSNRIKSMSRKILEYLMKPLFFWNAIPQRFAFIHLLPFRQCENLQKHVFSSIPKVDVLKGDSPLFFGPHEPSPSCFLWGKSIWGQLWHLLILKKNGSYRHFIPQIWTEIAGYSHMLSAFYLALPSKQPYVGSWWCCFDGRWHCEWLCHGTSWLFGLNSVFPLGSFYDGKLRHCWWEKSG